MESYTMVEERREVMVSPNGGDTIVRKALFLKPVVPSSIKESLSQLPTYSFPSLPPTFKPREWPLEVGFPSWPIKAHEEWNSWLDFMASSHESTWKNAGIHESIFSSTYQIKRNTNLVYGLGEKWCSDTNTFIFSWGEATITLEDVMVLGGLSILGESIFSPLESAEHKKIEENLDKARKELNGTASRKAVTSLWMKKFMMTESEYEYQAFIAYWLSRRIALAPAGLSCIYKDLSLIKSGIVDYSTKQKLILKSPFHVVQLWAWERFSKLSPQPRVINSTEPRSARWHQVNGLDGVQNWRRVLDLVVEPDFKWRPYAKISENMHVPGYYLNKEKWVMELSGFDSQEQYLPHHVARQFGYDQDLPCGFAGIADNLADILSGKVKLYIPSRLSEAGVSLRYSNWWKELISGHEDKREAGEGYSKQGNDSSFPPKCNRMEAGDYMQVINDSKGGGPTEQRSKARRIEGEDPLDLEYDEPSISQVLSYCKKHKSVEITTTHLGCSISEERDDDQ
ncbi:hypothetical protein M0R45_030485 [Rubus argutus]|uniref:Aminotransferase-like plant mobile domain-containing protein n=1 Tax=Rubus argutus TaxID=59490 RepID=A0AAW1WBN1_RUBAR